MKSSVLYLWFALSLQSLLLAGCGGGAGGGTHVAGIPATRLNLAQGADPQAGTGRVKWNPGHYVVFAADADDAEIRTGLSEIRNLPFAKGIVLRAFWKQLEPQKDIYDFLRVDRALNLAAAQKKRFFLLLSTKNFRAGVVAPDYLRAPLFDGGVFEIATFKGTTGENITLWDFNTHNRLILLIKALAAHYDTNPWFEGLILTETAFGQAVAPATEEQRAGFYANLIRVETAARRAFTRSIVIQYVNFPYPRTVPVVQNLLDRGLGFGSPDVFLGDEDHEKYVYPYVEQVRGQVPIGMQVESDSYYSMYVGGPWDPPPVRDIYDFARHRLHSNYIFWHRELRTAYRPWEKVLRMFRSADFPATPSGGLETRCPTSYARCVGPTP
jgi:hypothetical protein